MVVTRSVDEGAAPTGPSSADPWPGDFLLVPLALGSVALLILNDWVVKARWPGVVSGKLSDVAGMVFFPLLLVALAELAIALLGRPWFASTRAFVLSAAVVGLVFAATKTVGPVRTADEWALGQLRWLPHAAWSAVMGDSPGPAVRPRVVADASDLLAVPFVLVAVWIGHRHRGRRDEHEGAEG